MPVYEYVCDKCEHQFELFLHTSEGKPGPCPKCKSKKIRKLYSVFGLQIGGTGGGAGG